MLDDLTTATFDNDRQKRQLDLAGRGRLLATDLQ